MPSEKKVPCFLGLAALLKDGRQKSFLEKEKQDSGSSLFAAIILAWVFYNGIVMIIVILLACLVRGAVCPLHTVTVEKKS